MVSHAAYPTPLLLARDRLRIYFNTRDAESRGSLAWMDVDPADPLRTLDIADEPALGPGPIGAFDDCGLSNGSIHRIGNELWLYYMGWSRSLDVPFRNSIGLAISRDGGATFERAFEGPLLARSRHDPYTVSYPFVVTPTADNRTWRMLYGSNRGPGDRDETMNHVLTEATSSDGLEWRPSGRDLLAPLPGEFGLSRPWRFAANGRPLLLYSIRREHYSIGASMQESPGDTWTRLTNDMLGPSPEDWDNEATCYPAVIELNGSRLMFYCGNGFGRTGFGVAVIED
jgi:hypothetical protein